MSLIESENRLKKSLNEKTEEIPENIVSLTSQQMICRKIEPRYWRLCELEFNETLLRIIGETMLEKIFIDMLFNVHSRDLDEEQTLKYVRDNRLHKSYFKKYLINHENVIPLGEGYFTILKIMVDQEFFDDILITPSGKIRFKHHELNILLDHFDINDHHHVSHELKTRLDDNEFLDYIHVIIIKGVDEIVDHSDLKHIGIHILSLDNIEDEDKYLEVVEHYIDKNGSMELHHNIEDDELKEKIRNKTERVVTFIY